jgi:hypothetical protein
MSVLPNRRGRGLLFTISLFYLVLIVLQGIVVADTTKVEREPTLSSEGIIILTPGSSTDRKLMPGRNWALTTVLCLGEGTLEITLTKDDTHNDLVSMFTTGFPTDPVFIPSFGITPAEISVSTDITETLGGPGIVFILIVINSSESHKSTLSLTLEQD